MKNYYVYILTNYSNTVLYIGVTNDLVKRIWQHKEKLVEGFTQKYNISKLVYYELHQDIHIAIQREKTLKNLVRRKKIALVEKENPDWADLYNVVLETEGR